jgi:polyphosphate glucokinase
MPAPRKATPHPSPGQAGPRTDIRARRRPRVATLNTLAIDVGGTGLKASVLDGAGKMLHDRVRVPTPYPLSPELLLDTLAALVAPLPHYDRVSLGFPGMVRAGHILSAHHFISPEGPGGPPDEKLFNAWNGFDLQSALGQMLAKPARVANDADLGGSAVIAGDGLEMVLTLGTGFGSATFYNGKLMPHLELAHHPFYKGATYNQTVGEAARKSLGNKKWNKRVDLAIRAVRELTFFDHCYVGGGNSSRVTLDLPPDVTLVSNEAGILGGIKLWETTD